jgi:phage-related protein
VPAGAAGQLAPVVRTSPSILPLRMPRQNNSNIAIYFLTLYRNIAIFSLKEIGAVPKTEVIIFAEEDGSSLLLGWLDQMPQKVQDKCIVKIERLVELGHVLRRPEADYLRDGIYELRISYRGINYRILYFFHGRQAILSHGLLKESEVPTKEIDFAISRRKLFETSPSKHTYEG